MLNIEFYHLRSFVIVAKTGNLTLAAKQLCTTPPAISAHIKALESELKTPLFLRSSKGMELTEKGELLLVKAQKTLDAALDMVNVAAENQHDVIGTFRLSINQSSTYLFVNELLTNLYENCPGIQIELHQYSTGETLEKITHNEIDGGYVYGDVPDGFISLLIKSQSITTIAPSDVELDEQSSLPAMAKQPWITMQAYCPFDKLLNQQLAQHQCANINASDNGSRLELVKLGRGLSFIEKKLATVHANKGKVKVLPQLDTEIPLSFIANKKRINEPMIKALMQEVRILWGIAL